MESSKINEGTSLGDIYSMRNGLKGIKVVASGRRKNSLENAKIRIKIKEEIIKCFDHLIQGRLERLKFGDPAF